MATKMRMYEKIAGTVPIALYGSEGRGPKACVSKNKVKNRVDVAEMSCLRSMCRVKRRDRVRNEEIRKRCEL